jgi:hypothetical protein
MTFPERPGRWIDRNLGRITLVCVVGTCLCFIGLGYLQSQVRSQASDGQKARIRQCELAPISEKTYRWFKASGVITHEELQKFRAGAPSREECAALRR